jgi:hypothetical protein
MNNTRLISPYQYNRVKALPRFTNRWHRRTAAPSGPMTVKEEEEGSTAEEGISPDLSSRISALVGWSQSKVYGDFIRFSLLPESHEVMVGEYASYGHSSPSSITPELFQLFASIWRRDTAYLSNLTEKCNHWAYEQIITTGRSAVPLILRELETNPDYWFSALRRITGENPVPPQARGKLAEMATAWLEWARNHGYSW